MRAAIWDGCPHAATRQWSIRGHPLAAAEPRRFGKRDIFDERVRMAMRQFPVRTASRENRGDPERPILCRKVADFDIRAFDRDQHDHIFRRIGLDDFLAKATVAEEAAHALDPLWRIILAPAIRDIVERVQGVVANVQRFDPATAVRRFRIGAPDGAISVLVPRLVEQLQTLAPKVGLAILQLLPRPGAPNPEGAWRDAL